MPMTPAGHTRMERRKSDRRKEQLDTPDESQFRVYYDCDCCGTKLYEHWGTGERRGVLPEGILPLKTL